MAKTHTNTHTTQQRTATDCELLRQSYTVSQPDINNVMPSTDTCCIPGWTEAAAAAAAATAKRSSECGKGGKGENCLSVRVRQREEGEALCGPGLVADLVKNHRRDLACPGRVVLTNFVCLIS